MKKQRSRSAPSQRHLDELTRTACHEAGHAIVGAALFQIGCTLTIRPKGDRLGQAWFDDLFVSPEIVRSMAYSQDPACVPAGKLFAVQMVRLKLAGRCAESLLGARVRKHQGDDDGVRAIEYIDAALAKEPSQRSGNTIKTGYEHWYYVEREWRRTRRFLAKHWDHVSRVAEILLRRKTVREREWQSALRGLPLVVPWICPLDRRYRLELTAAMSARTAPLPRSSSPNSAGLPGNVTVAPERHRGAAK